MYFEELVKKISPQLERITKKLNGYFTFFDEDDLFQEALIHLWFEFKKGKLYNKTNSYILQSCYFYLNNYIRKNKKNCNIYSLDIINDKDENTLTEIENLLETKLLIEGIKNDGFTDREKRILLLSIEGFTVREIGKKLGISHVRVVKLKKRIKEKFGSYQR